MENSKAIVSGKEVEKGRDVYEFSEETEEECPVFVTVTKTNLVEKAKGMYVEIKDFMQNYKPSIPLPKVGGSIFNKFVDYTEGISEEERDDLTAFLCTFEEINLSVKDLPSMLHDTISFIIHHIQQQAEAAKYKDIKEADGYSWWSLKQHGNNVQIIIDGIDLENHLKGRGIRTTFGNVQRVYRLDSQCMQFEDPSGSKVIFPTWDFKLNATHFSRQFEKKCISDTHTFADKLNQKLSAISKEFSHRDEIDDSEDMNSNTANDHDVEVDENDENDQTEDGDKISNLSNDLIKNAARKLIGRFQIKIEKIKLAEVGNAIREINAGHMMSLVAQCESNFKNGKSVSFPPAVGLVRVDITSDIKSQLEENMLEVECIDGNHSVGALKQLSEKYPGESSFKYREIDIYHDLTRSEVFTLGLLHNEMSTHSRATTPLEKVIIMRKELTARFDSRFSHEYQDHIYAMFNALCPNDKKLENQKKKQLQHLLRLSTMADECWELVMSINQRKPKQTIFRYTELANLGVEAGVYVLSKILSGEKLSALKDLINNCNPPLPGERLVLQRLREPKQKQRKKQRINKLSAPNTTADVPSVDEALEKKTSADYVFVQELMKKNMEANDEIKKLVQEKRTLEEKNSSKDLEEIQSLAREKSDLQKENKVLVLEVTRLKEEHEGIKRKHKATEDEIDELRKENRKLKCQVEVARFELEGLKKEKERQYENRSMKEEQLNKERREEEKEQKEVTDKNNENDMEEDDCLPFSFKPNNNKPCVQENLTSEKQTEVKVVVWNSRVYLAVSVGFCRLMYCKKPIGDIVDKEFIAKEKKESFIINKKDIQTENPRFLITSRKCFLHGDELKCGKDFMSYVSEEAEKYLDVARSPSY